MIPRAHRSVLLALALAVPLAAHASPPKRPAHALRQGNPHLGKDVGCVDCHGKGRIAAPAPSATCLSCHGPSEELVKKTAAVKPENPHRSPHWGTAMECYVCHRQHQPAVNWCAHCHTFEGTAP